jgi:site-specific DNA recombinase
LTQFAETNGYLVPSEWQFQDDGFSVATLVRPGLEALRDFAAAGEIQTLLIYSPDRLSRKVLLAEELARCGAELIFLRAPSGATAEDELLVQFQGMIAEYERAGLPSVLAGASGTALSRARSMYCRAPNTAIAT